MRLKESELNNIRDVFMKVFGEDELYLFGSRVDDGRKGGDIDLYIVPASCDNLTVKKQISWCY